MQGTSPILKLHMTLRYDILATRPSKNWFMAILKPPVEIEKASAEDQFYNFELQAAHSKLCYFADTTCTGETFNSNQIAANLHPKMFTFTTLGNMPNAK